MFGFSIWGLKSFFNLILKNSQGIFCFIFSYGNYYYHVCISYCLCVCVLKKTILSEFEGLIGFIWLFMNRVASSLADRTKLQEAVPNGKLL